jgi:hypothetical protein
MREQQCLAAHAHSLMVRDVQNLYFRQAILVVARIITLKKITKNKYACISLLEVSYDERCAYSIGISR